MKRAHRGKDKYKVSFELALKKVTNLKGYAGSSVFISWRRGTKKTAGDTRRVIAGQAEAEWDERIVFESKLFMDPKSQKFDEKTLSLTIKEDNSKKKSVKEIAKVKIDLSNFATSNGAEVITIPFVKGAPSRGPCLLATIKTKPLKYNDKPLVKVSSTSHSATRDSRLVKTIAGEDYYLDRTASDPSPTTLDTASVASGDDDDDVFVETDSGLHEPDQYSAPVTVSSNGGGTVVEELRRRIEDLSQQVEAADSESFTRMATIRQKDKEISALQKDVTKLRRDKDDMVEQLERLKKPAGKSDVDTMRAEIVDRMAEMNKLEKEVSSLKKELASQENTRERETRSDTNSNELAALKARCTSLQQDNERLSKLLREKEKEKDNSSNGKGFSDDSRSRSATTNVVLSRDGREDDLRKQVATLRQELDEKQLLEKSVYSVEPQFRAGLSVSATIILDTIPGNDNKQGKEKEKEKILSHTLTLIVAGLETVVKRSHLDTAMLCYWLSTCLSILVKLRKKQDHDIYDPSSLAPSASSTSPLTRFEYSLTALASKIYAQIVKNAVTRLEEEIVGLLLHSHHMPRGTPLASGAGLVLTIINQIHTNLLDYHVPAAIAVQLFTQIYYYINAVLFNCMLTPGPSREDLCTCNSGFRIRLQLSRLEEWIPNPAQSSLLSQGQLVQLRDQLAPSVQASKLLVIDKKLLTDHEVFEQLCPVLSVAHIRRILSNYLPDALSPEPLPTTISQTLDLLDKKERDKGGSSQSFEFDHTTVRALSLSFLSAEK